jgi:hypothetical protein
MFWKGKELKTIGDACEALKEISTKDEAREFLHLYKEENPQYAEHNLGYLFGYFGRDRWKELSELFGILHPIFGDKYDLTDDEIMQMGIARGEKLKRERNDQG